MHFTIATIFGLVAATIAAPQPPIGGSPNGISPGSNPGFSLGRNSACFCCPLTQAADDTCGLIGEDGLCPTAATLICCDFRELSCSNEGAIATDGGASILDLGTTLNSLIGIALR